MTVLLSLSSGLEKHVFYAHHVALNGLEAYGSFYILGVGGHSDDQEEKQHGAEVGGRYLC